MAVCVEPAVACLLPADRAVLGTTLVSAHSPAGQGPCTGWLQQLALGRLKVVLHAMQHVCLPIFAGLTPGRELRLCLHMITEPVSTSSPIPWPQAGHHSIAASFMRSCCLHLCSAVRRWMLTCLLVSSGTHLYHHICTSICSLVQDMPVDPLEPPKFRHKKVPRGAGSPPVPVMHSPPRSVSTKELQDWKIPPCISNWKNAKGYTIPLDKRLAADGRGLQEASPPPLHIGGSSAWQLHPSACWASVLWHLSKNDDHLGCMQYCGHQPLFRVLEVPTPSPAAELCLQMVLQNASPADQRLAAQGAINDGFAKFTEALFVAEQQARQAVELRSKVQLEIAHREKAAKDAELRNLAIRCSPARLIAQA